MRNGFSRGFHFWELLSHPGQNPGKIPLKIKEKWIFHLIFSVQLRKNPAEKNGKNDFSMGFFLLNYGKILLKMKLKKKVFPRDFTSGQNPGKIPLKTREKWLFAGDFSSQNMEKSS